MAGAAYIGATSQKTKKKNEVSRRIWALLKADEEALKARNQQLANAEGKDGNIAQPEDVV